MNPCENEAARRLDRGEELAIWAAVFGSTGGGVWLGSLGLAYGVRYLAGNKQLARMIIEVVLLTATSHLLLAFCGIGLLLGLASSWNQSRGLGWFGAVLNAAVCLAALSWLLQRPSAMQGL